MDSSTTVKYIRDFNRNNLIKFLGDRNYMDVAAILKQKDIDGRRFLELTELDLVQWQLSPRQKKIILNCRDEIVDAHLERNKEKPTVPKKPANVTSRLNLQASFFQELESKLNIKQTEEVQRSSPSSTLGGYIDMTSKSVQTYQQSQRARHLPEVDQKGFNDNDDEGYLIPNSEREHPSRPPKHNSKKETWSNFGFNVTMCLPSLTIAKDVNTYSEGTYEDEPKLVSRVPEFHNHKLMPAIPPRPPHVKPGALPQPPQFPKIFEKSQLLLVKTILEETSDSKKELNPNDCQFYRNTDRMGARQLLLKVPNLADGAFVLRKSDDYFLALTIYYQNHFYNVGINRHMNGSFYCKTQIGGHVLLFKTLEEFVEYYKVYPITLKSKETQINICLREHLLPLDIY